jgi:hypothetical protein
MRNSLSLLLALLLATTSAFAQTTSESFQAETMRPASDRDGIIDVESGNVAGHLEYDAALWFGYANRPFRVALTDADGTISDRPGAIVAHRLGMNVVGQLALFDWVQIGADLAVVPLQLGGFANDDYAFFGSPVPAIAGTGDLRLIPKVRILRAEDQFVDLAVIPAFTVPTSLPWDGYLGEGMFTFVPEVAVSKELMGLRLAANLGFRFRLPRQVLNTELGQEIYFRGGAGYNLNELVGVPLGLDATLNAATRMFSTTGDFRVGSRYHNKVETNFAATYEIWRLQIFAGPGFGLWRGAGVPNFRIFGGVRYAPRASGDAAATAAPTDADSDGVTDDVDACPNDAEDPDGFEDTDGCPDADNDARLGPDRQPRLPGAGLRRGRRPRRVRQVPRRAGPRRQAGLPHQGHGRRRHARRR